MKWTPEQLLAINKEGCNILVSAGAGSGKTAVLTERVLTKLKEGIHINQLLILTFTNNAAYEMQQRIRKAITKANLTEELNLLDSAYINTFDSLALSIVRKYHTLLNITPDVSICESTVLELEKKRILDNILNKYYEKPTALFKKLIYDFCLKDDETLKKDLLTINKQLDMRYDKSTYLSNYLNIFFNEEFIIKNIKYYELLLQNKIKDVKTLMSLLKREVDSEYYERNIPLLQPLFISHNYSDIKNNCEYQLSRITSKTEISIYGKELKEKINKLLIQLKELCNYSSIEEIKEQILSTHDHITMIIMILKELDDEINTYKKQHDLYEFTDINKLAITLLQDNPSIRQELKEQFTEILIDEYQDTNDLQEYFISLISNNNVYMVGDIKQSIYRFRNANPYLFKEKYDEYKNNNGGIKIDLNKNFRSQPYVIEDINLIFNYIMDDIYGGANYKIEHQMSCGNPKYLNTSNNHEHLTIYNYLPNMKQFRKEEYEAFIIARDIKEKIDKQYMILDSNTNQLRPLQYDDITILLDRAGNFSVYQAIFDYFKIPLIVYKDENIATSQELHLLRNILELVISVYQNKRTPHFLQAYMALGRSFLINYTDSKLYDIIKNQTFENDPLYQKIQTLAQALPHLTCNTLLTSILDIFNYDECLIKIGNIDNALIEMSYFKKLSKDLDKLGYSVIDFLNYLQLLEENGLELTSKFKSTIDNGCKLMTIHKSKGLEFKICYYAGLASKFNLQELNDKIMYDKDYGVVVPIITDQMTDSIYKTLLKERYYVEEISEKIRLFYVALTRCMEKMIIVTPLGEDHSLIINNEIPSSSKKQYRSFLDILKSVHSILQPYIIDIAEEKIKLSKDYLYSSITSNKLDTLIDKETLIVNEHELPIEKINKHYSKKQTKLLSHKESKMIHIGTKIHQLLEVIDFNHPNLTTMNIDPFTEVCLNRLLNQPLISSIHNKKYYHEYAFNYQKDNIRYHGIIDLLIERDDRMIIIDYKLQNINDNSYILQLKGYQQAIESLFNKPTDIYLYSILNNIMKKINS